MNCSGVGRWLDRGMPADKRARAMRHVAICGPCAEAVEAASRLEAALRAVAATAWHLPAASAPSASPDFVANVMARVAAADLLSRDARLERRPAPLWIPLVTDPIIVSSVTGAVLVAAWTLWHPNWMLEAGMNLAAHWWSSAAALVPRSQVDVDPLVWIGLAVALALPVLWGLWALYRRVERAVLLLTARPGV